MLVPNEQTAKDLVLRIGAERAKRLLTLVCNRVQRRIEKANDAAPALCFDWWSIRKSKWEIDVVAALKLGLSLVDTYHTPDAARLRNLARVAKRKEERKYQAQVKPKSTFALVMQH